MFKRVLYQSFMVSLGVTVGRVLSKLFGFYQGDIIYGMIVAFVAAFVTVFIVLMIFEIFKKRHKEL